VIGSATPPSPSLSMSIPTLFLACSRTRPAPSPSSSAVPPTPAGPRRHQPSGRLRCDHRGRHLRLVLCRQLDRAGRYPIRLSSLGQLPSVQVTCRVIDSRTLSSRAAFPMSTRSSILERMFG
jgi:hypothetical protein